MVFVQLMEFNNFKNEKIDHFSKIIYYQYLKVKKIIMLEVKRSKMKEGKSYYSIS